jgi:hypothetical protein
MLVAADALRLHVLGVELQHLGGSVIGPDNGVRMAHCAASFD